jgi:hypothetical protein
MLHIHACCSVCFKSFSCLISMLQVFHLDVAYVLQWLQTCFFWCFRRILQVFQFFQKYAASVLSRVAKVDLSVAHVAETHLQQPPDVAAGPACMRVGVERVPRCRHGTRSTRGLRAGARHEAARPCGPHVKQAWAFGR